MYKRSKKGGKTLTTAQKEGTEMSEALDPAGVEKRRCGSGNSGNSEFLEMLD